MKIRSTWLAVFFVVGLSGCAGTKPMPAGILPQKAREGITVVEHRNLETYFISLGLTAFNNHSDKLTDPRLSIGDHLVRRLKAKGYNAKKGTSADPGLKLNLHATSGVLRMTGVGAVQRRPVMMKWAVLTHCNVSANVADPALKFSKTQPMRFGDKAFFHTVALKDTRAARWEEFSAAEKAAIEASLLKNMDDAADLIFSDLGL